MPKQFNEKDPFIDLSDINPNNMMAMSFNFELLKYVITSLIHNQRNMDKDLTDLNLSLLKQKQYSSNLEISIIDLQMQKELSPQEKEDLLKKKEEIKSRNDKLNKDIESLTKEKEKDQNQKIMSIYNIKTKDKEDYDKINENDEEVNTIEVEKNNENSKNNEKNKIDEKEKEKENDINNEKELNNIKDNESKNEIEEENEEKKDNIDNIDINENNEDDNESKNNKVENIEKTTIIPPPSVVSKSLENDEVEKTKNKNEDFQKQLQIIVGELKNVKSKQQTLDKDFSLFKQNISEKIRVKLESDIPSMADNIFDNKILSFQKTLNKNIDKINEDINNLNNNFEEKLTDLNNNILKEISLKEEQNNQEIEQLKRNYKNLKDNLAIINEKLLNMITTLTFNNLKKDISEKMENEKKQVNIEISILKNSINSLKNQFDDYINDSRDHDNLVVVMKTMESMTTNVKMLLDFKKVNEEKDKRKAIVETNKFIKVETFNEAINNLYKYIDSNKKEFTEIRLDLDTIRTSDLNAKANLRDLRTLEDTVLTKMENLKDVIREKFVEKTMLVKNLKFLEYQTKQLIEESKKNDKQDSWLLAKKPFNGHLCASCEAYIGDLKPTPNTKYVSWNKYPPKDTMDKVFRINAGFSKVLQMMHNQDIKNERSKTNSLNNSKEERNCSSVEGEKIKKRSDIIPNYKTGKSMKVIERNKIRDNTGTQIDEYDLVGTLPKISTKKNNNLSSINIFSEETNKSSINNSHIGKNNKSFNASKASASGNLKKSRSLVDDIEINNRNNNNDDNTGENQDIQKPKITKVYKRKFDSLDKKEDDSDNK